MCVRTRDFFKYWNSKRNKSYSWFPFSLVILLFFFSQHFSPAVFHSSFPLEKVLPWHLMPAFSVFSPPSLYIYIYVCLYIYICIYMCVYTHTHLELRTILVDIFVFFFFSSSCRVYFWTVGSLSVFYLI